MAHLGKFPFVPNMDDCKKIVRTDGATCFIMDTFSRNVTEEDKAAINRQIVQIAIDSAMRRRSASRQAAEAEC